MRKQEGWLRRVEVVLVVAAAIVVGIVYLVREFVL